MNEHTAQFTLGIDLSGAKLKVALFKEMRPEFIDLVKEEIDLYAVSDEQVCARLTALIDSVLSRSGIHIQQCSHIGIASPGNPEQPVMNKLAARTSFIFVKDFLVQRYGVPVYLENDANMAALGEYAFGAGAGASSMVFLLLGNSVGSGIVINGSLYSGINSQAGEVGQMIVSEDPVSEWYVCPLCGNKGCADSMASETALVVLAKDALRKGATMGKYTFEDVSGITAAQVLETAKNGDTVALAVVQKVASNIASVIYNIAVTLNPEVIVVGGHLSRYFDFLFPLIEEQLHHKALNITDLKTRIVKNRIAGDTGLLGTLVITNQPARAYASAT